MIVGALQGRTEEQVNLVNAPTMAEQRGIVFEEKAVSEAQDFNELIRVTVVAGAERVAVAGTGIGPNRVPHLVEVQGRRLTIELEPHVTVFRYEDLPGMIGRVGTIFGAHGINISSAAVGHAPDGACDGRRPAAGGDGRDDRRARARRGRRRRSSPPRASSTAGRSTSAERRSRAAAGAISGRLTRSSRRVVDAGGRHHQARRAGVLQVQERPDPTLGRGEVRIEVAAAGINFADVMARMGLYPDAPKTPCVVGYEVAGTILELGEGGRREPAAPGQRVVAGDAVRRLRLAGRRARRPTWSPLPDELSFEQGAAIPVNYGTAWAGLIGYGSLQPGERVLDPLGRRRRRHRRHADRQAHAAPRSTARPRPASTSASASSASTTRSTTRSPAGSAGCRSST